MKHLMLNIQNFFPGINTNKYNIHSTVRTKKTRTQRNHLL